MSPQLPPLFRQLSLAPHFPFTSPLLTGYRNTRYLKHRWYSAARKAGFYNPLPTISHLRIHSPDGNQVKARIDMATGESTVKDLISKIDLITALLRVHRIRVEHLSAGQAEVTVTFLPLKRLVQQTQTQTQTSSSNTPQLDLEQHPISIGYDTPAAIQLTKSLLIGGESESGKSNLVWHILDRLNALQIPYRLWVIDPAGGVELTDLEESPLTRQYADRAKDVNNLILAFHDSMEARLAQLKKRKVKRHFPTPTEPVEICIIDELLLVKAALNADDVTSPVGEILAVGRKALHIIIGCSQLGQKDSIGAIRDLFPQRICLRTRTREATDAVLGTQATDQGAACHKISGPGEGYVYTDQSETYEKILVPLIENHPQIANPPTIHTLPPTPKRFTPDPN